MTFLPCCMMIRTRNSMMIRTRNSTAIRTRVDAIFYYRTENRIPIRFAANRTLIRTGNRIGLDGPLDKKPHSPTKPGPTDQQSKLSASFTRSDQPYTMPGTSSKRGGHGGIYQPTLVLKLYDQNG
jgi:hypothetical protein